jgi:hypothetical protein
MPLIEHSISTFTLQLKQLESRHKAPVRAEEIQMKKILLALALFAIAVGNVWGQATAQIARTVRNQNGAVLPG